MEIERRIATAPRMRALTEQINRLPGQCVGCRECRGVCEALFEAMVLPDLIVPRIPD